MLGIFRPGPGQGRRQSASLTEGDVVQGDGRCFGHGQGASFKQLGFLAPSFASRAFFLAFDAWLPGGLRRFAHDPPFVFVRPFPQVVIAASVPHPASPSRRLRLTGRHPRCRARQTHPLSIEVGEVPRQPCLTQRMPHNLSPTAFTEVRGPRSVEFLRFAGGRAKCPDVGNDIERVLVDQAKSSTVLRHRVASTDPARESLWGTPIAHWKPLLWAGVSVSMHKHSAGMPTRHTRRRHWATP